MINYSAVLKSDTPDGGDGKSWGPAFNHPGEALDTATAGDQIWVAKGTYTRREDTDTVLLTLKSGVALYGEFTGMEFSLAERNWYDNETILDGEDAVYHVVVGAQDALLDGFTVTGGNTDGSGHDGNGGCIWTQASAGSPIVAHCKITQNSAITGGGMYLGNCSPLVIDSVECIISGSVTHFRHFLFLSLLWHSLQSSPDGGFVCRSSYFLLG
jgi:hypothetical protein